MVKRWKKAALISIGILLSLAGFFAFVLPVIVKSQVVQRVEAATGRKLAIGGISINPFVWTIEAHDLSFSERGGGGTFAAFSSARIAVSPLSLYRRAPIITAARITSPHLHILRVGASSYNFTDLLKWLPRHPRLSINNLTVTNGSVDFIDRGLPVEKRHELRKVELAVPFVTTIPYLADRYITPRLSAVVNGSSLHLEGKLRPFPRAVEATATIELKDVSLPYYLAYVPGALPVLKWGLHPRAEMRTLRTASLPACRSRPPIAVPIRNSRISGYHRRRELRKEARPQADDRRDFTARRAFRILPPILAPARRQPMHR